MLRVGINLPPLGALFMLLFYVLAGILVVRLFGLRSRVARFLVPVLVACSPDVAEVETFHYCSAAYGLSFLLAVAAVDGAVYAPPRWGWAVGGLCLMFSLSMYQASLGVAAGLCLMMMLLQVLRTPHAVGEWLCRLRSMVLMGLAGGAAYYVVLKLFLKLYDTSLFGSFGNGPVEILKGCAPGTGECLPRFAVDFAQN